MGSHIVSFPELGYKVRGTDDISEATWLSEVLKPFISDRSFEFFDVPHIEVEGGF